MRKSIKNIIAASIPFAFLIFLTTGSSVANSKPQRNYEIIEEKMLNKGLIISVATSEDLDKLVQDDLREIADYLAQENSDQYMVRVFFYNPGEKPGKDIPLCRFEWTKAQGLVLSYDRSRQPKKDTKSKIVTPKYEILDKVTSINGKFYADVLIESFSIDTPLSKLSKAAENIAAKEGFDIMALYCTREAFMANRSASYSESHPHALKEGLLGDFKDGKFSPPR
jgi:hypothetical protein